MAAACRLFSVEPIVRAKDTDSSQIQIRWRRARHRLREPGGALGTPPDRSGSWVAHVDLSLRTLKHPCRFRMTFGQGRSFRFEDRRRNGGSTGTLCPTYCRATEELFVMDRPDQAHLSRQSLVILAIADAIGVLAAACVLPFAAGFLKGAFAGWVVILLALRLFGRGPFISGRTTELTLVALAATCAAIASADSISMMSGSDATFLLGAACGVAMGRCVAAIFP